MWSSCSLLAPAPWVIPSHAHLPRRGKDSPANRHRPFLCTGTKEPAPVKQVKISLPNITFTTHPTAEAHVHNKRFLLLLLVLPLLPSSAIAKAWLSCGLSLNIHILLGNGFHCSSVLFHQLTQEANHPLNRHPWKRDGHRTAMLALYGQITGRWLNTGPRLNPGTTCSCRDKRFSPGTMTIPLLGKRTEITLHRKEASIMSQQETCRQPADTFCFSGQMLPRSNPCLYHCHTNPTMILNISPTPVTGYPWS